MVSALDMELSQLDLWRDDPTDRPDPNISDVPCTVAEIHLSSIDCSSPNPAQWIARDDVKGGVLPVHLVKSARARELQYLAKLQVYHTVPEQRQPD